MLQEVKVFPPNCEVQNSQECRLLVFMAKQREVFAEYGFLLGVKLKTDAERSGRKRYMQDWQRRYRAEHKEMLKEYRHRYWTDVQKKGFESKLEADGNDEGWLAKKKRKEMKEKKAFVLKKYGFVLNRPVKTQEEKEGRARYRKDQERKRREGEGYKEKRKAWDEKRRERNEAKFQAQMSELEAIDPALAAKKRALHERQCAFQRMSHEDRIRYSQQQLYNKLKAQAERAERIAKEREDRRLEKERLAKKRREELIANPILRVKLSQKEKKRRLRLLKERAWAARQEQWRKMREANAEIMKAEAALAERYQREREENLKRYLELKGRRDEG